MTGLRVVVTGGRTYDEWEVVSAALDEIAPSEIAEGGAWGADRMARHWAQIHGVPVTTFLADWRKDGVSAGPKRNRRMMEGFKPDLVVAFPGGKGTANAIQSARDLGIPVRQVWR